MIVDKSPGLIPPRVPGDADADPLSPGNPAHQPFGVLRQGVIGGDQALFHPLSQVEAGTADLPGIAFHPLRGNLGVLVQVMTYVAFGESESSQRMATLGPITNSGYHA